MTTVTSTSATTAADLGSIGDPTALDLVNWMLTDRPRFREALADEDLQQQLLPRLLAIATGSFFAYGLIMWVVVATTGAHLPFMSGRPGVFSIPLAYALGIVGAVGICLPSFWFFAIQCGFRLTLRNIVIAIAGGQALTSIFLIGILPVYAAFILGAERLGGGVEALSSWTVIGLLLPLGAGLIGAAELNDWFTGLASTLPAEARARREGVVEFLGLWSTGLYVVVAPVLVYQLLVTLGRFGV